MFQEKRALRSVLIIMKACNTWQLSSFTYSRNRVVASSSPEVRCWGPAVQNRSNQGLRCRLYEL